MRATDHLLETLEQGHLEPEVRVIQNGRRPAPTHEELRKRREAVKRLHNEGHTIEQIMAMFDMDRSTVRRDLYSPSDNTPQHVANRREKIRHIVDQGFKSPGEIGPRLWPGKEITAADRAMIRSDLRAMSLDGAWGDAIKARRVQVQALYDEGKTYAEIMDALDLTASQVRTDFRVLGLNLPMDLVDQRRERVRLLRLEGLSAGVIADRENIPYGTASDDIRHLVRTGQLSEELNVPTLTRKKLRQAERRTKIAELYPTGMPIEAIAEEVNASPSTVTSDVTALKEQGVLEGGRNERSPRLGIARSDTTGTNVIPMVENAITHMSQMADVLLSGDITAISGAPAEQWAKWEQAIQRVKRACTYIRRNQPNNQGD